MGNEPSAQPLPVRPSRHPAPDTSTGPKAPPPAKVTPNYDRFSKNK
jgi:hypothetical protein